MSGDKLKEDFGLINLYATNIIGKCIQRDIPTKES
jgi:hypothetical protein